jgi:two-component system heavy metal sensor histidine kinase CusS
MSSKTENNDEEPPNGSASWLTPKSLAARLTVWYACGTVVLVLAVVSVLYTALNKVFNAETDEFLRDNIANLIQSIREEGDAGLRKDGVPVRQFSHVFIRVTNGKGELLKETAGMSKDLTPEIFNPPHPDAKTITGADFINRRGRGFRTMSIQFSMGSGTGETRIIQIACDRKREAGIMRRYWRFLLITASVAVVAFSLIGYWIANRGMQRVNQIIVAAREIRSTTLHERIETKNLPSELRTLADTFNNMLDRLEESFNRLSRFSADIAHEIRTPVNNLRGEVEVALGKSRSPDEYRDVLGSTLEECERLSQIVDRLLFIAKAENAQLKLQLEPVDVAAELASVREFYDAAAAEAGVQMVIEARLNTKMPLDRVLFQRAVGNLVSNAISHTPRGGRVTIDGSSSETETEISVSDTGCGIGAEHLPHIFNRFYRVDNARSKTSGGVGLGLAIVKTIAQLHNATVAISSVPGSGTRITLRFPRTPAATQTSARNQAVVIAETTQLPRTKLMQAKT